MSKMKTDRKPPLAKSPIRLRPRRVLRSTSSQTPPGSLMRSQKPIRCYEVEESKIRPEYHLISCELGALARMVREELGNGVAEEGGLVESVSANPASVFERGRCYEEYAARRNERLKRKKGESGQDLRTPYGLGVTVESSKRRESKRLESLRKSVSAAYSVERNEKSTPAPRYLLRSMSKENKKPPLAVNSVKSVVASERKLGTMRAMATKRI